MSPGDRSLIPRQAIAIRSWLSWMLTVSLLFLVNGSSALAESGAVPLPAITPAKGTQCVEPVEHIRRHHMDMLDHQRDETVHGGIRGKKHSLAGCVGCHVQKDADGKVIPIDAKGQFCESCHRYAAVTIDCFSCHAAKPEQNAQAASQISTASAARFLSATKTVTAQDE